MGTLINLDKTTDLVKMEMVGKGDSGSLKEDNEMMEFEDEVEEGLRLDTLPAEILLTILDHLDVKFITETLSKVCAKFRDFAKNDATWRIRIARRWPGQYPAVPLTANQITKDEAEFLTNQKQESGDSVNRKTVFSWTEACIAREEESQLWGAQERSGALGMRATVCSNAHYSSVDCVKVIRDGKLVVSGSRDRGINIWNVESVRKGQSRPCYKLPDAHKGWVWSFSADDSTASLVSGSWDNTVKFWDVSSQGLRETRKAVNLKVAVLSTDMLEHTAVAGTFDKKVVIMDTREEVKKMTYYRSHSMPVLGLRVTDRHIFSLSEDRTLVIYDRAAGKRLKRLHIPGGSFPLSLSQSWNSLYVGDKSGAVHLIDTSQDRFEIVQSYSTGHSSKLTSVVAGLGSVLTASSEGDIRIHHPDRSLGLMGTVTNPDCGELAQISYSSTPGQQTLAAGFSNNTVKIWTRVD